MVNDLVPRPPLFLLLYLQLTSKNMSSSASMKETTSQLEHDAYPAGLWTMPEAPSREMLASAQQLVEQDRKTGVLASLFRDKKIVGEFRNALELA